MIPAGIKKGETEFFVLDGELMAMFSGVSTQFDLLPASIFKIVDDHISIPASVALDRMGITEVMARRIQFLKCNCGSFDFTPDIAAGSNKLQTEYVECGHRDTCPYIGQLCQPVTVNGHRITMAELKVSSLIRKGFYDKEICSKLSIAVDTLRSHKKKLQVKLGADRKTQIATQSLKYGI